jgi:hypothetical protein
MSEMSTALRRATNKVVKLAQDEDMVIVGFAVPKQLDNGDFGWSLFANCNEREANELLQTIAEVIKDAENSRTIN